MTNCPTSDIDLYSGETLAATSHYYRKLRELGPVVYLPQNEMYVVTHYEAVKKALRADDTLISGRGISANDLINDNPPKIVLMSDGEVHKRRRAVLTRPLMPASVKALKSDLEQRADGLVLDLLGRGEFCAVRDFASHLPVSVVADLVGLSDYGKERMLEWAAATFNVLGPLNELASEALPEVLDLTAYVEQLTEEQLQPGGWAAAVLAAGENGTLSREESTSMVADYVGPSLDTTILASAHMFWRLASTPGAFAKVRASPELVPSLVNESVRLASPIRCFTRFAASPFAVNDMEIPAGARVAVLYASANWDERKYADPDEFQIDRNPRDHVGWGHGVHTCVGMHLARLEMEMLASSLARYVTEISAFEPVPILNNILQGFGTMAASLR